MRSISLLCILTLLITLSVNHVSSQSATSEISLKLRSDPLSNYALVDAAVAYKLVDPQVKVSVADGLSAANIKSVLRGEADAGMSSLSIPDTVAAASPQLYSMPLLAAALVPCYRIDAIGSSISLILSRSNLAQIYMGSITRWNHPLIVADNPSLELPALNITLVLESTPTATTEIAYTAMKKFNTTFVWRVPRGISGPIWPLSRYSAYRFAASVTGLGANLLSTDGSLGILPQSVAQSLSVNVARMINKAGQTVTANPTTISFAAVELGTSRALEDWKIADLTDCSAASGWPISAFSYILIDTINSRSTCHSRQSLVQFVLNFYQSSTVASLLSTRSIAAVPDIVMTQLDIVKVLGTLVRCRGQPAIPAAKTTNRVLGVPSELYFLASLLSSVYTDNDISVKWQINMDYDQILLERLLDSELDLTIFNPANVDAELYQAMKDSDEYHFIPAFLFAWTFNYNPKLNDTLDVSNSGQKMVLDVETLGLISSYCVRNWNDPRILALNPWLGQYVTPSNTTANAVKVSTFVPCDSNSLMNSWPGKVFLGQLVRQHVMKNPTSSLRTCRFPDALTVASQKCQDSDQYGLYFAATESVASSLVLGTTGSLSYMVASGDDTYTLPSMQINAANGQKYVTNPDVHGMLSCASDTFDPVTMTFDLSKSTNTSCFPLTQQFVLAVRKQYVSSSTVTDARSCIKGLDALEFARWIFTNDLIEELTGSVNIARFTTFENVKKLYVERLNSVLCDQETLLITLPIIWKLNESIQNFGYAAAVIGCLFTCILIGFTIYFHRHPSIRSASPFFMLISLIGILFMFGGVIALVSPVSEASCSAVNWMLNLGLMVTFAPIAAKTYRLYRIFGRRKLSVVKISNRKLMMIVLTLLVIECILLISWQAVSPMQPVTTSVVEGAAARVHDYVQCSTIGDGNTMFGVIAGEKGALIGISALLAFSVRKVSHQFNESSQIALLIYNMLFSIGIIVPIIIVIEAKGDVLLALLVFVTLWIAFFSSSMLVIPKLLIIFSPAGGDGNNNSVVGSSGDSSSGFSFLSLNVLSSVPIAQIYLAALKKHIGVVEQHISGMKNKGGGGDKHGAEHTIVSSTDNNHTRNRSSFGNSTPSNLAHTQVNPSSVKLNHTSHEPMASPSVTSSVRRANGNDTSIVTEALVRRSSRVPNALSAEM